MIMEQAVSARFLIAVDVVFIFVFYAALVFLDLSSKSKFALFRGEVGTCCLSREKTSLSCSNEVMCFLINVGMYCLSISEHFFAACVMCNVALVLLNLSPKSQFALLKGTIDHNGSVFT